MKKFCSQFAVLAATLLLCGAANAGPVTFNATASSFTPGAGYGDDGVGGEPAGTLLEVVFTGTSGSASFTLSAGGFVSGIVGTVSLQELDILAAETDNLGVTANFTFVTPVAGVIQVSATGTAVVGPTAGDPAVDLTITWTGVDVPFGAGGLFRIDMDPLVFSTLPTANQNVFATITLVTEPRDVPVPVPATLPLLGLGLAGLGWSRRKRAR